jgi:hypothetical protein
MMSQKIKFIQDNLFIFVNKQMRFLDFVEYLNLIIKDTPR